MFSCKVNAVLGRFNVCKVLLPFFIIYYCSLLFTYNVIKIFTLKKHNLEVILGYFCQGYVTSVWCYSWFCDRALTLPSCRHSIVFYFQSFWKTCVELCFVCKQICGKLTLTKTQVLTDAVWNLIKNKINPLFPNVRIRRKAMQRLCFSTTWLCTASCLRSHLYHLGFA